MPAWQVGGCVRPSVPTVTMAVEISLAGADGNADTAGWVVAAAERLGDIDDAALVVAADVVAGDNSGGNVAVNLRLGIGGVVAFLRRGCSGIFGHSVRTV